MTLFVFMAGMLAHSQTYIQNKPIDTNRGCHDKSLSATLDINLADYDIFQDANVTHYVPKPHKRNIDWDNMVNVTFQIEFDEQQCESPLAIYAYPIDFFSWGNGGSFTTRKNWQDGTYKGEYGTGLWDFWVEFPAKIDNVRNYYVLKEFVDIQSDTTIIIDQRTSTQAMEVVSRMPDGEIYKPDVHTYGSHNIDAGYFYCSFHRIEDGIRLFILGGMEDGKYSFINELSDRFSYNYFDFFIDQNSSTSYMIDHTGIGYNYPNENDPANWEYIEESFKPSVIDDGQHKSLGLMRTSCYNGLSMMSQGMDVPTGSATSETAKIYVNAPRHNDNYTLLTHARYGYRVPVISDDGSQDMITLNINGAPTIVENGAKQYFNIGPLSNSSMWFNEVDGLVARQGYPGNLAFSFTEDQKTSDFGSGTPICLFVYPDIANVYPNWAFAYIGRYGEEREVDRLVVDMSMKVNGTEVCTNYGLMNQYLMDPERPTGEIDITMNNENIMVDGLQGCNYAQMHIDENNEDKDGPTVTMLWFKDGEDHITDRFATREDGLLEFSAGDFNAIFDASVSNATWFRCAKPEVEVSYSPYCEDAWDTLEVEEIPENFYMPCFGHFYRGSLGGVKGKGLQGWFDLKIRLEDAAGNWQEQVISPAFRIDNLAYSSVATVGSGNAHEVARYTLDGRRADASTQGVVIVKMSDGTAKKELAK